MRRYRVSGSDADLFDIEADTLYGWPNLFDPNDTDDVVYIASKVDATIASLTKQLAEAHDQLQASQCAEKMSSDLLADARRNEARLTIAVEALTEIESHGRVDGTGMIAEDLARRALDEIGKLP